MAQHPSPDPTSTSTKSPSTAPANALSTEKSPDPCSQIERDHPQHTSTCPNCQERMTRQFDKVLRGVMLREGWTEEQVHAVSPLRGFASKQMKDLAPDPGAPIEVQRRVYARNCVEELQARIDAAREVHQARIDATRRSRES
ncbi:hypothetical protein A1O7_08085 [Cladophialophora yegresii CBS 114405]|uniref:Uncharacterized protein n=1 Tax=Cladophialophora yegresii CBS 114405 TaxID=1182544 RepID=W9VQ63_9EURO|nr:uncharacterized protein A1O7_08085 [Cladophialophora yegresii CBS 114405]EXJ55160.1 hypothetical protein A1O7_08085 [Cladophialophora yegresii CBS 114405]